MFNSTVRKCSETPACVRVASGLLPIVLALAATQLAYPQSQPIATILQGQLLTTKGVPVAGATVQWSFVGAPNPSQTGASDSAGNFAFEIPLATPTQVQLATNANLYTPTQTSVQLQPGTTTQVQVKLTRRPGRTSHRPRRCAVLRSPSRWYRRRGHRSGDNPGTDIRPARNRSRHRRSARGTGRAGRRSIHRPRYANRRTE